MARLSAGTSPRARGFFLNLGRRSNCGSSVKRWRVPLELLEHSPQSNFGNLDVRRNHKCGNYRALSARVAFLRTPTCYHTVNSNKESTTCVIVEEIVIPVSTSAVALLGIKTVANALPNDYSVASADTKRIIEHRRAEMLLDTY